MAYSDLYDACAELLAACCAALDTTPDGCPECHYVSPGPPPWDSYPALIVHAGGPGQADTFPLTPMLAPGHRTTVQGQVNLVVLVVTILRCAPAIDESGSLPIPAEYEAVARQTNADLWACWNWVRYAKKTGALFPGDHRELFMDPAVALIQAGGAAGWQLGFRVELDGYRPF